MTVRYLILIIAGFLLPLNAFAQIERNDSLSVRVASFDSISVMPLPYDLPGRDDLVSIKHNERTYNARKESLNQFGSKRNIDLGIPRFEFEPSQAKLFRWKSGNIMATGEIATYPGLMQEESGTLGFYQSVGKFTFYSGGKVNKYGYFRGLNTQYGLEGRVSYEVTPRLLFSVFGTYYFDKAPNSRYSLPLSPAIIGFYNRSTFGGSVDYKINEYWGVEAGMQAVRQLGTRKYELEPIATPYYRISKKVKIGLPVGQFLYHVVLKDRVNRR